MLADYDFLVWKKFRSGDYHFCCLNCSVFIDFIITDKKCLCLHAISFDGYGYCGINERDAIPLSKEDSKMLRKIHDKYCDADEIQPQDENTLTWIILNTITVNRHLIWEDALIKYELILEL